MVHISKCGDIVGASVANSSLSPLVRLPYELQVDIFSRLHSMQELANAERICRGTRLAVLEIWRREVPEDKRAIFSPNTSWKQAWLAQCKKLETFEDWGAKAAQACKAMPDDLNPFDVEARCNHWLQEEQRLGSVDVAQTLGEVFDAFTQTEDCLKLSYRMHSLPPFIDRIKTLRWLMMEPDQIAGNRSDIFTLKLPEHCIGLLDWSGIPY